MAQKKVERPTHRGFSEPTDRVTVDGMEAVGDPDTDRDLPRAEKKKAAKKSPPPTAEDMTLDIEQVRESGTPALLSGPWRAIEVWTRNRIYGVDGAMICRVVTDRSSGLTVDDHPALGARLIGGQKRGEDGTIHWVAHPLPARGGAAVFARVMGKRMNVSETSDVTRVVVRQRVVEVGPDQAPPPWDEITG